MNLGLSLPQHKMWGQSGVVERRGKLSLSRSPIVNHPVDPHWQSGKLPGLFNAAADELVLTTQTVLNPIGCKPGQEDSACWPWRIRNEQASSQAQKITKRSCIGYVISWERVGRTSPDFLEESPTAGAASTRTLLLAALGLWLFGKAPHEAGSQYRLVWGARRTSRLD